MELNEFKDRLFDLINESSSLSISDIIINRKSLITIAIIKLIFLVNKQV